MVANISNLEEAREYLADLTSQAIKVKNDNDYAYAWGYDVIDHPVFGPVVVEVVVTDGDVSYKIGAPLLKQFFVSARTHRTVRSFDRAARMLAKLAEYVDWTPEPEQEPEPEQKGFIGRLFSRAS